MNSGSWITRKSERLRVTLMARCKTPDGADNDFVIVNFTQEGCCLALNGAVVHPGQSILIRLESGDTLAGTIRWMRQAQAGVLFDEPLSRQRTETLRREHSTFLSEVDWSSEPVKRPVM